ncbi:MAG: D-alanyl-D-alanine carboxypeptidase [Ruminococcus sp.]|nr:D-alanyl-D-alanine carboxypeptidase [Ruminococcus sp.]
MKKKLSLLLSVLIVVCTVFTTSLVPVSAANYKNKVKLKSKSALLINLDTGQTVYSVKADEKRYPASTTKIMTYIVVAEHVSDFKRTKVEIKQSVLDVLNGTGSSVAHVFSHVGETMTVLDLLYSMMVPSGNDAAVVLADYIGGGDTQKFVDMMNEKAKELGCKNTHFTNPDGLHDDNHYTTANDLAIMTQYALTLPEFSEITNTATYYVEGESYPLVTTNYMIDPNRGGSYYYQYAQGVKTGTTDEAGHCLVSIGSADGYSYLGVFLMNPIKEPDEYGTMIDAKELFRWALTELELNQVASSNTPICEQKINLAWGKSSVQLVPETNINSIVPKDYEEKNIIIEKKIPESVDAPIKEGDVIGKATVYYEGKGAKGKQELATVNLVSSETVERSGILYVLSVIKSIVFSNWFIVVIAAIILLLIIYIIVSSIIRSRNRKRRRNVRRYRNF